jgi:phage terminase large subunit-like protein
MAAPGWEGQELDGELIADREDGLWRREQLEALVVRKPGPLGSHRGGGRSAGLGEARYSCCGIIAAGLDAEDRAVVLADGSVEGASPSGWAEAVSRLYRRFDADCVVAEINQGGDMVTSVLRTVDPTLPVGTVRATRGKWLRAEPVAALYEQGRVVHAGPFCGAGRPDVRFRPRRAVVGPLAGPARCAGLGADRTAARTQERAAGAAF